MANSGCEVHRFDPGIRAAHIQEGHLWYHRLSIDWRDPNPAIAAHKLHANTKRLGAILNDFGHYKKEDQETADSAANRLCSFSPLWPLEAQSASGLMAAWSMPRPVVVAEAIVASNMGFIYKN
uniref:Methyltransferase-like protein 24 n=1 Tax=Sphaerodactylus townsendi TaxID=933632 RepID=A0ACB8GC67_9SAUR